MDHQGRVYIAGISEQALRIRSETLIQGILRHWALALVTIVVVAALSFPQIDKYMLGVDALHSMLVSGWIAERAYSPSDVLNAVYTLAPDQAPLYFLLLNQWGNLLGHEIAMARVFTMFFGLLALAMAYRLGRDMHSPAVGNFAVIIMASNAFYSFFSVHVRFYTLLVLLSAIVIWLYLRIAVLQRSTKRRDYVFFTFACAALVSTHAFGFMLYIVCALYHLLFVPKNGRWLAVVVAALLAPLIASPIIYVMLTKGVAYAAGGHGLNSDGLWDILVAWFYVTANGSAVLVVLTAVGATIAWRSKTTAMKRIVQLFAVLLIGIELAANITGTLGVGLMRHLFPSMPIAVLFQAAALHTLYARRKMLAMLVCLWPIAGIFMAGAGDLPVYIQGRVYSYNLPPWHIISRIAQQPGDEARVIAYKLPIELMTPNYWTPVGLFEYWFTRKDIELKQLFSLKQADAHLRWGLPSGQSPWLAYQRSLTDAVELAKIETVMSELGYQACRRLSLEGTTEMVKYDWFSFNCKPLATKLYSATETIEYEFFGSSLDPATNRLFFSDLWRARSEFQMERFNMSFQVVDADWKNVAQLDLPLVNEGELRQYWIDVSDVPPGSYRLMGILYNAQSGEREAWRENVSYIPEMLDLGEVVVG